MDVFNTGNIREHINTHFSSHTTNPLSPLFFYIFSPLPAHAHLVLFNDPTDVIQVFIGEHKSYVATDVRQDLLQQWVLLEVTSYGLPDGGVLAHDDCGPVSERDTDLLHLLGADIVHVHQEEPGVLVKERLNG